MGLASCRAILLLVFLALSFSGYGQEEQDPYFIQKEFKFSAGDFILDGRLLLPDTLTKHPVILNVWGSGPTRMEQYINRSDIVSKFTDSGYAVLIYDKPGSGASRGTLSENRLLRERAQIARASLEKLKNTPFIDPARIGLYGSSQAAYIISMMLEDPRDISFVICWSCPMENSIEQSAYQVEQYLLCAGRSSHMAEKAAQAYCNSHLAEDYKTYFEHASYLNRIPEIRDELGWGEIMPVGAWKPVQENAEELFDPAEFFAQVPLPVLAIYGTLDKNINPHQAVDLLNRQQNQNLQTAWIPDADHNMITGGTGCVQEQIKRYHTVPNRKRSLLFENTVITWLRTLQIK